MSTVDTTNTAAAAKTTNADGTRSTTEAQRGLNTTYNDFLKLLTTQLTNQDPTAPLDTNQITQQIAMLSQVEQQINTNTSLQQLLSFFTSTQSSNAVSYIGRQVDAVGNQGILANEHAQFVYNLPSGVATADITISNSAGQVVANAKAPINAGRNQVIWDGKNSYSGQAMADGAYTFVVKAKDANGKDITVTPMTTGTVSAVNTENGKTTLSVGNITVPIEDVKTVYNPGTNPGV